MRKKREKKVFFALPSHPNDPAKNRKRNKVNKTKNRKKNDVPSPTAAKDSNIKQMFGLFWLGTSYSWVHNPHHYDTAIDVHL